MTTVAPAEGRAETPRFMNVKQVAGYLNLNDKTVYALVSEGKIPATKVTGKWLFPRELIDRWLIESSHSGLLTDRLVVAGSDDPLMNRAVVQLASEIQTSALITYTPTGTRLGLGLLSAHRADLCGLHWGPRDEAELRHPALLRPYPSHRRWILVRAFAREQGLMISQATLQQHGPDPATVLRAPLRFAVRQEGAGSQRFFREMLARLGVNEQAIERSSLALSEREAASMVAMGQADAAPGVRAAATEFGLAFVPIGWEAFDLAMHRDIYFRRLFRAFFDRLQSPEFREQGESLGGYDFSQSGEIVWSEGA
jgi:excisionase family DNA binding protein